MAARSGAVTILHWRAKRHGDVVEAVVGVYSVALWRRGEISPLAEHACGRGALMTYAIRKSARRMEPAETRELRLRSPVVNFPLRAARHCFRCRVDDAEARVLTVFVGSGIFASVAIRRIAHNRPSSKHTHFRDAASSLKSANVKKEPMVGRTVQSPPEAERMSCAAGKIRGPCCADAPNGYAHHATRCAKRSFILELRLGYLTTSRRCLASARMFVDMDALAPRVGPIQRKLMRWDAAYATFGA
ncbi:MAG: hypothetical protein U0559_05380 [Anaerolineae bacterium]